MNSRIAGAICSAVLALTFSTATHAQANSHPAKSQSAVNSQSASSQVIAQERQEAKKMVPAHAELLQEVDAKKFHPGEEIRARLERTIQLANGSELTKGTLLLGKVTEDSVKPDDVRLALRFDQARNKDGSTLPMKVMILSIEPGRNTEFGSLSDRVPASEIWSPDTLQVNQMNAVAGADLHSSISSSNSAVISTSKKDDVVIDKGSEIDFVIAGQQSNSRSQSSNSGA